MTALYLLRHACTSSNLCGRYLGRTDEPLCKEGVVQASRLSLGAVDRVFVSPLSRCVQTARIVFPQAQQTVVEGFQECDFGEFEGKNYQELGGDPRYQAWIDSGGELPFPSGESKKEFCRRTCRAFEEIQPEMLGCAACAVVAHGGTLMALLERYALPRRGYYEYQVKNCCGFLTQLTMQNGRAQIKILEELSC